MNTNIFEYLRELVLVPSVSWFEQRLELYLIEWAKKNNYPYLNNEWKWVLIWNPYAKNYFLSHIDEVWWWISYVDEKNIHIEPKWRVNPSLFIWKNMEIITENKIVECLITNTKPLDLNEDSFRNLRVNIEEQDRKFIKWWDQIRYKSYFSQNKNSIIATWIDNKIWVSILMDLIDKNKSENFFEKFCFCFNCQEEDKNQWAIFFMMKYKPQNIIVVDVIPDSLFDNIENFSNDHIYFQKKTVDYDISQYNEQICNNIWWIEPFCSDSKYMIRTEVMQYQNITRWNSLWVMIPVNNYHNESYFISIKCIDKSLTFLNKLLLEI